jgi:hypothetical protein
MLLKQPGARVVAEQGAVIGSGRASERESGRAGDKEKCGDEYRLSPCLSLTRSLALPLTRPAISYISTSR